MTYIQYMVTYYLDLGLKTLYVVNHLVKDDFDQSAYYHKHRTQCIKSCLLSAFTHKILEETSADD